MTDDKRHQEDLKLLMGLRLIDDDFMTACFDGYIEGAQLLLRIILEREDLVVSEVKTQKVVKNLQGRDLRLDILASDTEGHKYNIEIQRSDKGADRKRARYHSSMIDAGMLSPGDEFTDLAESCVIFITEHDVLGENEPIYHIERHIEENNALFGDGEHIIYVNGSMRPSDTALGKLMRDFYCTEAKDIHYKELSDKVRYFKETEEGVDTMCKAIEDMRNETEYQTRVENAIKMIMRGKYTLEEIAEDSGLSIEKVRELAGEKTA